MRRADRLTPTFPWETAGARRGVVPYISVVLPVYNQREFLLESARSVLEEQSLSLELVIVDDGSTDGVEQELTILERDRRVQVVRQENQGLAGALNTGFALCCGDFLTWTSADNRYRRGGLERLARYLVANPSVGLVYGNVLLIDEEGEECRGSNYRRMDLDPDNSAHLRLPRWSGTLTEFHDNFVNACFLYRRSIAERVGVYDPDCRLFEDFDYWIRVAHVSRLAHVDCDEPLYEYRLHRRSLTAELDGEALEREVCQVQADYRRRGMSAERRWPILEAVSPLLRRARDSHFFAVVLAPDSEMAVVVLMPEEGARGEWAVRVLSPLILRLPTVTFALLCEDCGQRSIADRVHLSLNANDNLRILDLTAERNSGVRSFNEALMYSLSSVDGVVSLAGTKATEDVLLAVWREAAIAAMAGLPHVVLLEGAWESERTNAPMSPHLSLLSELRQAPHLFFARATEFESALRCGVESADLSSMEQWVERVAVEPEVE